MAVSDKLSDVEVAYLNRHRGVCPSCKEGLLHSGPCGGYSQNFRCDCCEAEFNLYLNPHDIITFVLGGEVLNRAEPGLYGDNKLCDHWGSVLN